MNVLFITIADMRDVDTHGIYSDLMREFLKRDNNVYIASPAERRNKMSTGLMEFSDAADWHKNLYILKIKTGNFQKTNFIEKGLSTLLIESQLKREIKRYYSHVKFDLVLYTTPPITLFKPVKYIKQRDNALCYLLLKDIFPQNAVDLGILSKKGLKSFIYKSFRKRERKLYSISDVIGCMSQANVDYVLQNNRDIPKSKVEVCPNSVEVYDLSVGETERKKIREKYNIPSDKLVFVYGGNLGRPQGIDFLVQCLHKCKEAENVFFLIMGNGTEYYRIKEYIENENPQNVRLLNRLPQKEYDAMIGSCDVGLIFLDHRFTIPNFPSRLLGYLQAKIPVLAVTDPNTDVGKTIVEGGFGWWCESNDANMFAEMVKLIIASNLESMKEREFEYLKNNYSIEKAYKTIQMHITVGKD